MRPISSSAGSGAAGAGSGRSVLAFDGLDRTVELLPFGLAGQRRQFYRRFGDSSVRDLIEQVSNQIQPALSLIGEVDDEPGGVPGMGSLEHRIASAPVFDVLQAGL